MPESSIIRYFDKSAKVQVVAGPMAELEASAEEVSVDFRSDAEDTKGLIEVDSRHRAVRGRV